MKTIFLIRHAKSSHEGFSGNDAARPLNERGKKDAPAMAQRLLDKDIAIDAFMTSPAVRASTTARLFAEVYGIPEKDLIEVPSLYMADSAAFIAAIRNAPDGAETLAVFSHNNGITQFANSVSDARIDHMPTCSVFAVQCDIARWQEFQGIGNRFLFFDSPKNTMRVE